jgi:hypothetical protein
MQLYDCTIRNTVHNTISNCILYKVAPPHYWAFFNRPYFLSPYWKIIKRIPINSIWNKLGLEPTMTMTGVNAHVI